MGELERAICPFFQATGEKDPVKSKASYLLIMGEEAFEIHKQKGIPRTRALWRQLGNT
jgi:hypothetical protein